MVLLLCTPILLLFWFLVINENIMCFHNKNLNIEELKCMIENKDLYINLKVLESLIIKSLYTDELKIPILKPQNMEYLGDMSNFKIVNINTDNKNANRYIIPNATASTIDLIKYEHITKEQLIQSYTLENSDLVKKKIVIVRSLKIIKFMLTPMNTYKEKNDFKKSLIDLNEIFMYTDEEFNKNNSDLYYDTYFQNVINEVKEIKKQNPTNDEYLSFILDNANMDTYNTNNVFFTTDDNIKFMTSLDKISNYFGLGMYTLVGSHLMALGHFVVLTLALRNFEDYFVRGELLFFSWQKILQYNVSDRFRILDIMCNGDDIYYTGKKRRKSYLKNNKREASDECNILEFLIHYFNKYEMELIKNIYQEDFKTQIMLEHNHMKDDFFKFMCNDFNNCNIYRSNQFLNEGINVTTLNNNFYHNTDIDPFNLYTNFSNFITRYNNFTPKKIIYMHFLNLTGILNNNIKAYVTSLYLPGYYNAIELSFDDKSNLTDLFSHLIQCIEKCILLEKEVKASQGRAKKPRDYKKFEATKCNMCKGTYLYISKKHEEKPSMLQKYYNYVINVIKINNINNLIRNVNFYEDYDNFLTNDINWYTFLLLFRLTSYEDISHTNVAEAMYLSLKNEDTFHRSITTSYWFPSALKKAYTLYLRKNLPKDLVEKLQSLLSRGAIEKMKKSIKFLVHVNSFLQLDFFSYLNEPPVGYLRPYALSIIIEHKFKEWYDNSQIGYFFLNYDNELVRKSMKDSINSGKFVAPKYEKWNFLLKRYIMNAYESYFQQRNVKNLFKYHSIYNITNRIMLMKDSYDLYSKNYKDVLFLADIFNIKKYISSTPNAKIVMDRTLYYMHSIAGNSVNYYRYGIIYGFKMNNIYFKEIANELFVIYMMNKNIFSDISFLQSVYLLFRKIEDSFYMHRRNDKTGLNNVFFFDVSNEYSKLTKEQREEEINNSMASKFFAKTLFTMFQMMFAMKLSNNVNVLDKKYGKPKMLALTLHERAFFNAAYAYYGSILDNIKNSFLPPYAKKTITQIKYGRTFIFANLFILCSKMYSILKLNNLSLLCEHQAIASPNYYSSEKVIQYINRKYIGLNLTFFVRRIQDVHVNPNEILFIYNKLLWPDIGKPIGLMTAYVASNLFVRTGSVFPESFFGKVRNETKRGLSLNPAMSLDDKEKPIVHAVIKQTVTQIANGLLGTIFFFNFMRLYAIYQTFVYIFVNNIRVLHRFYRVFEYFVTNLVRTYFRKFTTDKLLKKVDKALRSVQTKGYMEESMRARLEAKNANDHPLIHKFTGNTSMLSPQVMDTLLKNAYSLYVDDDSFFDISDEEENFLNDKDCIEAI
ncbi:cytoadherence linked asexual protein, putative [Plasmodium ovale]|uniref:Cytoadherence linked asexual protein, putative n=1 Tax=Plasmodium ovale TaxID=36330 RepID=A0A1C3KR27_PLAOA|nr:cytoadherence linked asexual protein, putative [Plasmodium ovale]